MVNPLKNIGLVILAAGKGKRLHATSDLPKVLTPLCGQPLLAHLLERLKGSVVQTTPVVVIAPDLYVIRERIGPSCEYAIQESQLGTGHAVLSAKHKLLKYDHVLTLYGDHPLVTARTIDTLTVHHLAQGADITMATLRLPHFDDWYAAFECYGRIVRNGRGGIARIVEKRDANVQELALTEVNVGYYLFRTAWLWNALTKLDRNNVQGEYLLTDLIALAIKENRNVSDIALEEPEEALGINTPDQLATVERIMQQRLDDHARFHTARLPI